MSDTPETTDNPEGSEPDTAAESAESPAPEAEAAEAAPEPAPEAAPEPAPEAAPEPAPEAAPEPAPAVEAAPAGDPLKAPGLWPGLSELVLFAALVANGAVWGPALMSAKSKSQFEEAIMLNLGAVVIMTIIWHFIFKKRHAKREGRAGNNGFFRIRDMVMFTTIGLSAPMVGLLVGVSTSDDMRQAAQALGTSDPSGMAVVAVVMAVIGLAINSKIWGRLAGSKSILWGLFFMIMSLSAVAGGLMIFKMSGDHKLIGGLVMGVAQVLLGICFLLGGLGLFKAAENRGGVARKVAMLLAISWLGIFLADVMFGLDALNAREKARGQIQIQMAGLIFPGFLMYLLAGLAMLKHRKTLS